jgi:hypothetical protein
MRTKVTAGVLVLGLSAAAMAADPQVQAELDALKAQIKQQASEIQELRASTGDTWLNQRRAEEIKSLIHEVLSDAETRASLQEGGLTAGWRDNFFLASEDGNFLMRVGGQAQIRYVVGYDQAGEVDDRQHHEGFEVRRAMISFDGHLFDPRFTYQVSILMSDAYEMGEAGTGFGFAVLQNAWAAYEFADGWQAKVGQFKAPFMRDELVHSSRQLAVERAYITDLLTADYVQGAQVGYNGELVGTPVRAAVMVHDGSYSANGFAVVPSEDVDIAVAARAEVLLAGAWEQFDDYTTWSGDSFGLLLGAAVDYENGEGEDGSTAADILKWTVDASVEVPDLYGFNATAALTGLHPKRRETVSPSNPDQWAVLVQAGVFVIPDTMDIFGRWEFIDLDGQSLGGGSLTTSDAADEIHMLTFGGNYYFQRHAAKLTLDLIWTLDSTANLPYIPGQGLIPSTQDDQLVLRGQFQFLF